MDSLFDDAPKEAPKRFRRKNLQAEWPFANDGPARAWARIADVLVARALAASEGVADACRRPSTVTFIEVKPEWLDSIAEAWGRALHPNAPYPLDGDGIDNRLFDRRDEDSETPLWCEFRRTGRPAKFPKIGSSGLNQARFGGLPVYGFAPALNCLPPGFDKIHEHHVTIPSFDAEVLAEVVAAVCGAPPSRPIPAHADVAGLGEEELLLAMRPGQTPDDYVECLLKLCPKASAAEKPRITLDDIGGMREAVAWGYGLKRDLDDYRAGRIRWSDVDPGALLHGRPGTGKTTFARALAGSCGVPLFSGSVSRWQAKGHLGDMLHAMRSLFEEAGKQAPSLVFIDEFDSFQSRDSDQGQNSAYHAQTINGILELLDGVEERKGVVVIAACNDPTRLDPALVRAGRLDTCFAVPLPDAAALDRLFRIHLKSDLAEADLAAAVRKAEGHTGADVKRWVRRAGRAARTARRPMIFDDLLDAIDVPQLVLPAQVLRRIAVHEAGHALHVALTRPGDLIEVRVRPTRDAGGYTASRPDPALPTATLSTVRAEMSGSLAGRAAETIVFGAPCAGSGGGEDSDLARATLTAAKAIANCGLGEALAWRGPITAATLMPFLSAHPATAAEVELLLAECEKEAVDLLRPRRHLIEKLADLLLTKETVDGAAVDEMVRADRHPEKRRR